MSGLNPLYYNAHFRALFQHQLQFWRAILTAAIGFHLSIAAPHLYYDWNTLGPDFSFLKILDILVVILSVANRVTWRALFLDAHQFLGFRRPSRSYRRALSIVIMCTVALPLLLHLWIIYFSLKAKSVRVTNTGIGVAISKFFFLLVACCLYLWMVRRFLVGEDDERYEPTALLLLRTQSVPTTSLSRLDVSSDQGLETYINLSSPSPSDPTLSFHDHLATAYLMQPKGRLSLTSNLGEDLHGHDLRDTEIIAPPASSVSATTHSPDRPNQPAENLLRHPLRCRTVARFDYVCQSRVGLNSWLTYPLIAWAFAVYSTVLLALVCKLIYEDKYSRLSSPKARTTLRAPLGGYLFCAFAMRYRIRKSLFSSSEIPLPAPWIKIKSLFGKVVFKNSETGASATINPYLRAFPAKVHDRTTGIRSSTYLSAYNSTSDRPSTCNDYWGHLGREWIPKLRNQPTTLLLGFLIFASVQVYQGSEAIFNFPLDPDKVIKLPDVTDPDLERYIRIQYLKLYLMTAVWPFVVFIFFYAFFSFTSVMNFYRRAVLEDEKAKKRGESLPNVS